MKEQTLEDWLESLAAKQPTPGGGAAASLLTAAAAALIEMVTIYTQGPRWLERQPKMQELNQAANKIRSQSLELAEEDAKAFSGVMAAYALPKITEHEVALRQTAVQQALIRAADVPVKTAEAATTLVEMTDQLVETCNPNLLSDVGVAAASAKAALESAVMNIEINARSIHDQDIQGQLAKHIEAADQAIDQAAGVIVKTRKQLQ